MRVCRFVGDLSAISRYLHSPLNSAPASCDDNGCEEVYFVGYRDTRQIIDSHKAYLPYGDGLAMRGANAVLRFVDSVPWIPASVADVGLSLCGTPFVEMILACDPDIVALDVRWGNRLSTILAREFSGQIHVTQGRSANRPNTPTAWRRYEPSAKVSIVLPTHNGSRYLRQSIQSCIDQSHRSFELIVVDDGSTEDIKRVLAPFDDSRIRYVRHEVNRGLSTALNTGFRASRGDYLTWTSDDNYYAPDALERLVRYLQSYPQIDFTYACSYVVDEMSHGNAQRIWTCQPAEFLRRGNGVGACFLYTRRVYDEVGEYNSATFLVEDYDYWVRVSKKFRMQRILSPLYYYRYHKDSLTSKHSSDEVAARVSLVRRSNQLA